MNNLATYKKIELDGKEYLIKFDYNGVCDLEALFGKGIASILTEEQVGFNLVRAFYWAGLKWKMHGLTIDNVGRMLGKEIQQNGKNITDLMAPVMDALKQSGLLGSNSEENDALEAEFEELNTQEDTNNPN